MGKFKRKSYIYFFVAAAALFLLVYAGDKISYVLSVFKPVFGGIVIAYLLDGMVRFLNKKLKMKRGIAIALVIVGVIALGTLAVYFVVPLLIDTTRDLINYIKSLLAAHNNGLYNVIESVSSALNINLNIIDGIKIDESLLNSINDIVKNVSGSLVPGIVGIGSSIITVVSSVIMAVYMLIEKESLIKWMKNLIKAISPGDFGDYVLDSFSMTNSVFKKFIIGKFIDSAIIGFLCFVLFKIFGISYAAVFAIITGVGNMIPYFGPIIAAVPVEIVLLIIDPKQAIIALVIILVVQQLDGNFIGPKVLSDNIGVSAFWIFFGVTIFGMAFGFVGMVVGVPVVVAVKNLIDDFIDRRLKEQEKVEAEGAEPAEEKVVEEYAEKQ